MRVVVGGAGAVLGEGLIGLLEDRGHQVCAAVADADALLVAVAVHRPDVAVVDIRMPPTPTDDGLRAALQLGPDHPGAGVLGLSLHLESRYAAQPSAGNASGAGERHEDPAADSA